MAAGASCRGSPGSLPLLLMPRWHSSALLATLLLLLLSLTQPATAFVPRVTPPSTIPRSRAAALAAAAATSGSSGDADLPTAVVIVPGYASDATQYRRLEESFRARGIPAWTVPISTSMWLPTFGGRSIRPILDRLHKTVLDVSLLARPLPPAAAAGERAQRPQYDYSPLDFVQEMADPSKGARSKGSTDGPGGSFGDQDPPSTQAFPKEERRYQVTLVGHSAGGWLSRIYLSTAEYDGRVYNGARFVSTLITLGSPHVFPARFAGLETVPYALRNLKFVNERCAGPAGGDWEKRVRVVCVASRTVKGGTMLGGLFKDWAASSYELCGYDDAPGDGSGGEACSVWGDGITPLESALGVSCATVVSLEGVYHGPEVEEKGLKWYGTDPEPLEQWIDYVLPPGSSALASAPASSSTAETA